MATTAYHRDTPVEIKSLTQGPNSIDVVCSPRGTMDPGARIEVPESALTAEEWATGIAFFTALERAAAAQIDSYLSAPERIREQLTAAEDARKEKAALDAEIAAKREELAALDAQNAAKKAEKPSKEEAPKDEPAQ